MEFILYLYFSYFLPPFTGGSRDSRHYHSCVHNLRVSTVYTLMLLYLLLYLQHYFRTFAPVFFLSILNTTHVCTVYRKRKLRKSIYIDTMVPVLLKHNLPLPERFHHNFLLLSAPLLYIQPAIKLRESNQAENEWVKQN